MRDYLLNKWIEFRHNDEGVTLVEYGIAIILAVTVGTGTLLLLAGDINTVMGTAVTALPGGNP